MNYNFKQIGVVKSCFKGKFGTPRQPGITPTATGDIELDDEYAKPEMISELLLFSHIWVIFVFHETLNQGWKPTVRPPRLGGNKKMGIWATRSNFRPNPIGMSVVKIEKIEYSITGKAKLYISNHDIIENTPILDIKPYLPYADAITNAITTFEKPNNKLEVTFKINTKKIPSEVINLISEVISQDPRPAFHSIDKEYHFELNDYKISFIVANNSLATVTNLEKIIFDH